MASDRREHHFIVYDLGRPWKKSQDIALDYLKSFRRCPQWGMMQRDLAVLTSLPGDSYDSILTLWNGQGLTPTWLVRDFKAVGFVYASLATVKQ